MDFRSELKRRAALFENELGRFCSSQDAAIPARLRESMDYSLQAGGKRLRPVLCMAGAELFGAPCESVLPMALAFEMVHTASLIHDDLPCMDNDTLRRGKPTNHKAYGETTAIFAGDALLNYAFETMLEDTVKEGDQVWKMKKLEAMNVLAKKSGAYGMLGGQMVDYLCEQKNDATLEELLFIHEKKTAALIQAPLIMGAIFAGANREKIARMEQVGYLVGISYQIQDDILDCIGDEKLLGKKTGSDAKNAKTTYVTIKGLKDAQADQERMSREAEGILSSIAEGPTLLRELVESLIHRES